MTTRYTRVMEAASGVWVRVDVGAQILELWEDGSLVRTYPVSTSRFGLGTEPGSMRTPLGRHRVARKFGDGLPRGAVLKERTWTGAVWSPGDPYHDDADLILTRILWLEGMDDDNATTFDRYIYIHGTNQEHLLGQPASHGCIRMAGPDVEDLFARVPEGAEVAIA